MSKISSEDRAALLNSEVYMELEYAERIKQAQSLSDKIINSPTAQKAISDGITKALENKADDWEQEHEEIRANIKKLDDHVLFELAKMFQDEVDVRDLDTPEFEEEFEEVESTEDDEDEKAEEEEMEEVFAYVKSALTKMAEACADRGETDDCYLIERAIQSLDDK